MSTIQHMSQLSGEFTSQPIHGSRHPWLWLLSLMILRSQHHQPSPSQRRWPLPCYLCLPRLAWRDLALALASVSRAISGESTFHPRIITIAGMEAVIDSLDSASGPCFRYMISAVRFKWLKFCRTLLVQTGCVRVTSSLCNLNRYKHYNQDHQLNYPAKEI